MCTCVCQRVLHLSARHPIRTTERNVRKRRHSKLIVVAMLASVLLLTASTALAADSLVYDGRGHGIRVDDAQAAADRA